MHLAQDFLLFFLIKNNRFNAILIVDNENIE